MKALINYMRRKAMNQVQLAAYLEVTQTQVSHWVQTPPKRLPNIRTLKKIHQRTGISLNRLVADI
jgi:predicted XRE-type DNA-binding protein